jgi:Spy/CpxP family protein refolding chaperone
MKRLAIMTAFALLNAAITASAQSLEDFQRKLQDTLQDKLGNLQDKLADLAQAQTPFGAVTSKRSATNALQTGLQGMWWREARWIRALDLTPDQQTRMDEAFRQNRIKLIDLTATLEKAEVLLEPLVENIHPGDEPKILAQIDDIANARAELEKVNARMLLAIRQVLTQEQWDKLPKAKNAFSFRMNNGRIIINPSTPPTPPSPPEKK